MLSPEQFKLLESNADKALILHGVAGSGKTTLALHRLSWLLGQANKGLQTKRCVILVSNAAMKEYLKEMAEGLGLHDVAIKTKYEWAEDILKCTIPEYCDENKKLKRSAESCSTSLKRIKGSSTLVSIIDNYQPQSSSKNVYEHLLQMYSKPNQILEHKQAKLFSLEDLQQLKTRAQNSFIKKEIDDGDEPLLLLLAKKLSLPFSYSLNTLSKEIISGDFDHIVVDEAQDYTTAELAAIAACVKTRSALSIVGDTAQTLTQNTSWQSLLDLWKGKEDLSNFISLTLSFRSTIEIRKYAAAVRNEPVGSIEGRNGRAPIWFQCSREARAFEVATEWVKKSLELYPNGLTTVLCATAKEAKELTSMLTPSFRGALRYADSKSFSFHAGIIVAPIDAVRGMEFSNLFIWNPSAKNFPNDDYHRNILYIALTRSRENVALVTFEKPSSLLPSNAGLVRIIDYNHE